MWIILTNKRYGVTGTFSISDEVWEKHLAMHKVRPEEALQNNLSVCYGYDADITTEMIEKVINDEYEEMCRLPETINEARRLICTKQK